VFSHPKYRINPILSWVPSQHTEFVVPLGVNKQRPGVPPTIFSSPKRFPYGTGWQNVTRLFELMPGEISPASKKATLFHRGEFTGRIAEIVKEPDYS
jgi:hypothetical protein